MILYVTDKDGEQYEAVIDSEEHMVEVGTFADNGRIVEGRVQHHVTVTKRVGEFNYSATRTDDPAVTLQRIYELIEREING